MLFFHIHRLFLPLFCAFLAIFPHVAASQDDFLPTASCPETCISLRNRDDTVLRVVGSTTIQPILEKAALDFSDHLPDSILIEGGGSGLGVSAILNGTADLGMVSRKLTDNEKSQLSFSIIGYDALAIIVNARNPREAITKDEILELYTGVLTIWPDFQKETEVLLVSKLTDRGTLFIFEEYSGLKSPFHPGADTDDSPKISTKAWEAGANLDSILWVGGLQGAIGFVSALEAHEYIAQGMPIKILGVDGFYPDMDHITTGLYPMRRCLKLVHLPDNQPARIFTDLMLSSAGQEIVREKGFIPLDFFDDLQLDESSP
jgi:phosphate transport system substrate-binding protein